MSEMENSVRKVLVIDGTVGFTVATMLNKQLQGMAQVMHDTSVREGVKIDNSLQFRLAYFY
mgnify:CR=1 FL=1